MYQHRWDKVGNRLSQGISAGTFRLAERVAEGNSRTPCSCGPMSMHGRGRREWGTMGLLLGCLKTCSPALSVGNRLFSVLLLVLPALQLLVEARRSVSLKPGVGKQETYTAMVAVGNMKVGWYPRTCHL
jgi:hypothetical protein